MEKQFKLMATCSAGIEGLLGEELRKLGYQPEVKNGMAVFTGGVEDIIKTNLWLRTADRIKIIVGEFKASDFDSLFEHTKELPWADLLPMDAKFPVEGRSHQSALHSVPDVQAIVKKAVVSSLSDFYHRRTRLPENGALYPLEVRIYKNQVLETLDTTGESLFKRGYRVAKGEAPLKENMAAALVLLTNWKPQKMSFLDPMCGSGTIPIEAALMARNVAPGLMRHFTFENWDWVNDELIEKAKENAKSQQKWNFPLDITASDINGTMVDYSRVNAENAGVLHDISFKQVAVADFKTDKQNGVLVTNPPYGQRLGDSEAAIKLYGELGKVFIPMASWSKYYLTSDLNFEKEYGEKATKRRKLYNGQLRVDDFQYWAKTKETKE